MFNVASLPLLGRVIDYEVPLKDETWQLAQTTASSSRRVRGGFVRSLDGLRWWTWA